MGKLLRVILLLIFSLIMVGCSIGEQGNKNVQNKPQNNNLEISGIWYSDGYEVLDKEISTKEEINEIVLNKVKFDNNNVVIANKRFDGISYKLKMVNLDYMISYEAEFKIQDLGLTDKEVKVYSVYFENNLLGEIINISEEESYLYYQGILFNIKREGDITESSGDDKTVTVEDGNNSDGKSEISQGIYLGLKCEGNQDKDGNYIREEYRTIWISTNKGELQSVKQRENIIFPRNEGIWILQPKEYKVEEKGIYYEYFNAMPLEKSGKTVKNTFTEGAISKGKVVKKSINYVGNNYIASEVTTNEKFSESPVYEVLPIDNLNNKDGIVIGDLFGLESNKVFKENYEKKYAVIDEMNKTKLSRFVNYSNYTMVRNNGKWVIQGRISPVLSGGKVFDYLLSIKPSRAVINYDTLIIPWKVLKGEVPFLVDAFTSPNGKMAIIITKSEIKIYKIMDGELDKTAIKIIPLKEGEKVIMSEWCEGAYVDKWDTGFNENSSIID